jgi:hypothetical protein
MMNASQFNVNRKNRVGVNLLTPNQASGTDTLADTTGFSKNGVNTLLESSTEEARGGTRSLKVVTNNEANGEGTFIGVENLSPNKSYTFNAFIKGTGTIKLTLMEYTMVGGTYIGETSSITLTLTDNWQPLSVNRVLSATGTYVRLYIITSAKQAATFYVDSLSFRRLVP